MRRTTDIFVPAPGPGKGYYLVFNCGLTVQPIMIRRTNKNGSKCPTCGASISHKIFLCEMCGKHIQISARATLCRFCIACRKIEAKLYQRRLVAARLLPPPPPPVEKAPICIGPIDRSVKFDCKWYLPRCLPVAAFKPGGMGKVDCKGCLDYTPAPLHATVDGHGQGFVAPTHGCSSNWHA